MKIGVVMICVLLALLCFLLAAFAPFRKPGPDSGPRPEWVALGYAFIVAAWVSMHWGN